VASRVDPPIRGERSRLHRMIRANNELWSLLYYDELIEAPSFQLTYLDGADAGFYNCAQAIERFDAGVLESIERYYRGKGVAPAIYVDPDGPGDLAQRLLDAGYVVVPEEQESCHVLDLTSSATVWPDPQSKLKIAAERVTLVHLDGPSDPLLDAFVAVDAAASALPRAIQEKLAHNLRTRRRDGIEVHCFVAVVDGEVASTRLVGLAGDVALYAEGGTLPAFRRLGLYSYLMLEGLRFARAGGKQTAFQTASRDSHSNPAVLALGFTRACVRAYYQSPREREDAL
jgi:GNAT superfamily N-acetyltransferase